MDIILNTDLKHILQNLNLEQKGLLLDKLLNQDDTINDDMVKSFYTYIQTLQDQKSKLKEKMKKLSLLGHQKRWNQTLESPQNAELLPPPCRSHAIRKEPKEDINNNLNIKINNIPNDSLKILNYSTLPIITPPQISEVNEYIKKHNFNVDAEVFVDFYTSRGWCVGKSEIRNWQAIVRLWHKRAPTTNQKTFTQATDDEKYWHELKDKFWTPQKENKYPISEKPPPPQNTLINRHHKTEPATPFSYELYPKFSSHFSRFMQKIEENDINI